MRGGTEEEIVFRFDLSIHGFSISSANRLQFTSILDHINEWIYKIQDLQDITLVETNQTFSTVERNKFAVIIIE